MFTRAEETWTQEAVIRTLDDPFDSLGTSVALSGDTAVITVDDTPVVFVRTGTSWTEQARLTAFAGPLSIVNGHAVAISEDTVVVGASHDDTADGTDAGLARVYTRTGTTWAEQAVLTPSDAAPFGLFGSSVAVSGNTAVVSGATSAYLFTRTGAVWSQEEELRVPGATTTDFVEIAVGVDGDTAVVGVPVDDAAAGAEGGAAYVFTRAGTTWARRATLTPAGEGAAASFGRSVAVSGGQALVGAYLDDSVSTNQGSVYVFVPSEVPHTPALSLDDVTVVEGNTGKRTARFTVTLSEPASEAVSVRVATANGTARAPIDYVPRTTILGFAPGQSTTTFDVRVKGDTSVEPDETFQVLLDRPHGAAIADATATGTIENDD